MATPSHPSGLNVLRQFRQANHFLKHTSRARNAAWYKDALELDFQLHIRTDGANVNAFLYDRSEDLWAIGPPLTERDLLDPEAMAAYTAEAVKHSRTSQGKSLGFVLHIANEFALTEIKPEFNDREALQQLREAAVNDPVSVLADASASDQASWRILPYFAARSQSIGTAVTVSRQYEPTLDAIRALGEREDFPVITHALSAPLIALLGFHQTVKPVPGRSSVVILQYPFLTVLAFFDENWDLLLIRTQLHRGLRRPPNFRHAIATTSASLELVDPNIFVFPLGQDVDHTLVADLALTFAKSHVERIAVQNHSSLPNWCAECLISTRGPEEHEEFPGITFRQLHEEKWAFQDFLPPSKESAGVYPTYAEMRLLRIFRYARFAAVIIGLLALSYLVMGLFEIVRTPEWTFDPADTAMTKKRLAMLNVERQKIDHWDTMLEDRSKGWASMEALSRLFPENSGILVKAYEYNARPDTAPAQAKVGFVKEWKINGFVKDDALELLNALNTREGIAARFNEVAKVTGNSAFRTDIGTRSVVVNIRTQENGMYRRANSGNGEIVANDNGSGTFPYTFDLVITQRFEATDPLAIIVGKAP